MERYRSFSLPVDVEGDAKFALDKFLASHRVTRVEKAFSQQRDCWIFCVSYEDDGQTASTGKEKVQWDKVFKGDDLTRFLALRKARRRVAEKAGVDPYLVFYDNELAEMVKQTIVSRDKAKQIEGLGEGRLQKYWDLFVQELKAVKEQMLKDGKVELFAADGTQKTNHEADDMPF